MACSAPTPRASLLAAVVLACGLAGCSGDGAGPATVGGGEQADEPETSGGASLTKPQWSIGDSWTYDFDGASTTYVVTAETSSDWVMETDSAERSFSDAREDISRLGPQRKSDLAGSQGQDRVEFFRWPLEAGKAWTTRWDHLDVTVRVVGITDDVATMEANLTSDGSLAYRYTYSAGQEWFGDLWHFAPDGTERVHLALTEARPSWTGTIVRWALTEIVADAGSQPPAVVGPQEVPAGTTDIWVDYHFTCTGNGGYTVALMPANPGLGAQQGYHKSEACLQVDFTGVAVESPHPGTWGLALTAGGQEVDYSYAILLRTRIEAPFPA